MPDVAKFFMEFCMDESCGKCVPCRVGTVQMHRMLERITDGSATLDDLEQLEELCTMVQETSLCGLGQICAQPDPQHACATSARSTRPTSGPPLPGRRLRVDQGAGGRAGRASGRTRCHTGARLRR